MPPKGGNMALSEAEVKAAVDHMLEASKAAAPVAQATPSTAPAAPPAAPAAAAAAPPAAPVVRIAPVNSFNRLLKPPAQQNLPPTKDGIHDPANVGTTVLQPPLAAFAPLPKANTGNRVDWVLALEQGHISPRHDLTNPNANLLVMDLNIVRQVKGTMPDVLFPHKQHTAWLDCSNCHVGIFIPQKGANQMSMATILLGQGCGVCHGKVAFPVSDCAKCHSQSKASPAAAAPAGGAGSP
jgi:c(7)-type cytochrome triheme protein